MVNKAVCEQTANESHYVVIVSHSLVFVAYVCVPLQCIRKAAHGAACRHALFCVVLRCSIGVNAA